MLCEYGGATRQVDDTLDLAGNATTVAQPGGFSVDYAYDANGNLTSRLANGIGGFYTYDNENRLIGSSWNCCTPGSNAYVYDAVDRRVRVTNKQGLNATYLWAGEDIVAEYDNAGVIARRYVYGPGIDEPVAMVKYDSSGTETGVEYYHQDALGSVVATSNADGTKQDFYRYSSFGEVGSEGTGGNPFRYTGRQLDPDTGLYYYRARYYAADIGRFLQTDPIGYQGGMNLYAYVGNDPINYIDPMGTCAGITDYFRVTTYSDGSKTWDYLYTIDYTQDCLDRLFNRIVANFYDAFDPNDASFPTVAQAGEQGAREINPTSIKQNREYSGALYKKRDGSYSFTPPKKGNLASARVQSAPWFHQKVGDYHTHGGPDPRYDNENFSDADKSIADRAGIPMFLGTPNGDIKMYSPNGQHHGGRISIIGTGAR